MSRAPLVRALVALTVLGLSLFAVLTTSARLGLDLRGGTQIVLETRDGNGGARRRRRDRPRPGGPAPARRRPRRERTDARPVRRAPHPRRAARGAGPGRGGRGHRPHRSAHLPPGHRRAGRARRRRCRRSATTAPTPQVLADESGAAVAVGPAALTGEGVSGAVRAGRSSSAGARCDVEFRGAGGRAWEELTGQAACAPPGDPAAAGGDRPGRPGHQQPAGRPGRGLRRRHRRRHHEHHRQLHRRRRPTSWPPSSPAAPCRCPSR